MVGSSTLSQRNIAKGMTTIPVVYKRTRVIVICTLQDPSRSWTLGMIPRWVNMLRCRNVIWNSIMEFRLLQLFILYLLNFGERLYNSEKEPDRLQGWSPRQPTSHKNSFGKYESWVTCGDYQVDHKKRVRACSTTAISLKRIRQYSCTEEDCCLY